MTRKELGEQLTNGNGVVSLRYVVVVLISVLSTMGTYVVRDSLFGRGLTQAEVIRTIASEDALAKVVTRPEIEEALKATPWLQDKQHVLAILNTLTQQADETRVSLHKLEMADLQLQDDTKYLLSIHQPPSVTRKHAGH